MASAWRFLKVAKLGASSSKAPAASQASITAPTGGTTVDAEARTAINAIITRLEAYGLVADN